MYRTAVTQVDVGGVRLPLGALHFLRTLRKVAVAPRLALRIKLAANGQVILPHDSLRTLVTGRCPGIHVLGATMVKRGEATSVAALARVADVLSALRQIRDTLALIRRSRRDRVKRLGGAGSAASMEHRVADVCRR